MAKKRKIHKVELKSIVVECSKLAEKIPHSFGRMTLRADELFFESQEASCYLCGSHGAVSVEFKCLCGKRHNLKLEEW